MERDVDVVIISEPYKVPEGPAWAKDKTQKAAIWACGNFPIQKTVTGDENGYVAAVVSGVYIFSCYAAPSLTIEEFQRTVDRIAMDARRFKPIIIAGDFNAWAEEWGSRLTNARGQSLLEALAGLDLVLVNVGDTQTFRGHGRGSVIDITFASPELSRNMSWEVSEDYSGSDHQAIHIDISTSNALHGRYKTTNRCEIRTGWVAKALDVEVLKEQMRGAPLPTGTADTYTKQVIDKLKAACDASMPRRRSDKRRKPVYWWNETIKTLRANCFKARRKSQRAFGTQAQVVCIEQFKEARQQLRNEIRSSKKLCFKKLCDEADANPWGSAYRLVRAKLGSRAPAEKNPEVLKRIIHELFPNQDPEWTNHNPEVNEIIPTVTAEEVLMANKKVGANKASGPDDIPNRALKEAIECNPSLFADMYQLCIAEGTFPKTWKRQRLVLLPKPGKSPGEAAAYRPICLLDTAGKILERIILNRLTDITECRNGLSPHQFGFRKKMSTLDAIKTVVSTASDAIKGNRWKGGKMKYCALITLDIKNAFNTANWGHIMHALKEIGTPGYLQRIIGDYLKDRVLLYETDMGTKEYTVTGGVPQGSVLGPILWNIMYDKVLRLKLPSEAKIIGFADDIVIAVTAKHLYEIEAIASKSIATVKTWIEEVGLKLAEHKTEVLLVSGRKVKEHINVKVGSHIVHSKEEIKYLGVLIDTRVNFKAHLKYATEKAAGVYRGLARMMSNHGGPRSSKRALIASVVNSTLLYGAQIWAEGMNQQESCKNMQRVHRLIALRVICAFRTVSYEAAVVIAGMPPISIMANEAQRLFNLKQSGAVGLQINKLERAQSLRDWQHRWDTTNKGRWTYRLIPNLEAWLHRRHGEVDFYLSQFLSGHGCYRKYLFRFGHAVSPLCVCGEGEEEDAEHVMFKCRRFRVARQELLELTRNDASPDNIVEEMVKSEDVWNAMNRLAKNVNDALRANETE